MYILFDKTTKVVENISANKFTKYTDNLDLAEYKGEIPKNDYLTVTNLREETETWTEKKTVPKTITVKEPQTQKKLVYEEIDVKDENGNIELDDDGNPIKSTKPKFIEETINVEVEKEIEEEIEETKSRTYLACDLVANFYPTKTEEELAKEKEKKYSDLVSRLIRKKYSQDDVEAIFANYLSTKVEEEDIIKFNQFQEYREECKKLATKEVYGE